MSSFFAKSNNYKDYFLSDNNGQSIPLASLILVPCVTLFLAYSTLVSKSDKNKENVTDNLDPINTDEDEDKDNDNDNDEDEDKDDTNNDDTNDSITNNNKKSPITITQGGKQRQNKKSKTTKKKSKKSKTIKKKNKKSKTIKKK